MAALYGLLEKELELAHDETLTLDEKLSRAAGLILGAFPQYAQCLIYLWDGKKKRFELRGAAGTETSRAGSYGEGEGLPGEVRKSGSIVEVAPGAASSHTDKGLDGFSSATAYPVKDRNAFHGVVFLKSAGEARIPEGADSDLRAASIGVANIIRCSYLIESHHDEHARLVEIREKLYNAEKLMALGDMAAILAHEVKNPIISLGGFIARVKKSLPEDSPSQVYVENMMAEISRVEKIMNGVIRFLKDSAVELELGDASEILDEALTLFAGEINEFGITVVKDYYGEPLPVLGDREQLKIAFDNIISNAIQSMETGGTLRLSTARTEDQVVVRISDTGGGIDPRVIGYIFNPFFTTKEHGTGLGLPITNSIVMRHRGMIEVINNEGIGVTFAIKLPYAVKKEAS